MLKTIRVMLIALMCVSVLLGFCESVDACPTCKDAMHQEHSGVATGYYWSILFMMSMPFIIFAGWGIYLYRVLKNAKPLDLREFAPG